MYTRDSNHHNCGSIRMMALWRVSALKYQKNLLIGTKEFNSDHLLEKKFGFSSEEELGVCVGFLSSFLQTLRCVANDLYYFRIEGDAPRPAPVSPEAESMESGSVLQLSLEALISVLTYLRRILATSLSLLRGNCYHLRKRWKLLMFVIVWPFVANFALAYLYYRSLTRG